MVFFPHHQQKSPTFPWLSGSVETSHENVYVVLAVLSSIVWRTVDGDVLSDEALPADGRVRSEVDDDRAAAADDIPRDRKAAVAANHLRRVDQLAVVYRHRVKHASRVRLQVKLGKAVHRAP